MGVPLDAGRIGWGATSPAAKLRGVKRYPLVLMLEPLFQCNLACAGCGKIDHPKEILQKRMSVADALARGGRMWRADGVHSRRRAPDPQGNAAARRRDRGAPEVRVPVHERDPAAEAYRRVSALAVPDVLDPPRRESGSATTSPCARRACSTRPSPPSGWRARKGFRVTVNCTLFSGEDPDHVAAVLR